MSDATPIDEALEGLSELAGCDLRLAKRFCARIEALPEDEDDKAMDLARSYQRMARSYRQTLVVQARLRRELKAEAKADAGDARAERDAAERARHAAAGQHRLRVRRHFERALWDEYEEDEAQAIFNDLDERLAELADDGGFLDTPAETLIARLIDEFAIGEHADADADADEDDADDAPAVSPSGGKRREAPQGRVADGGSESDAEQTPPIGHSASPSGRFPPEGETAEPPAETPPDPEPPPRPPDPPPEPPYIPPWERNPYARYPGGSGW